MARQTINVGTSPNARDGDPIRSAFQKVNANFTELYNTTGADIQIPVQTGNNGKFLTTDGTNLSWASVSRYTASTTAPTLTEGAMWFNSDEGRLYVNYNNTWVDSSPTEIDPSAIRFNNLNQIELPEGGDIVDINGDSVLGGGGANLGDWAFRNDLMYSLNGGVIENSDTSHGATSGLTIPTNGSDSPIVLTNTYGNVVLVSGVNAGSTVAWTFNNSGTITTPLLLPKTFTAVLDNAHRTVGSAISGTPWQFTVAFVVDQNGAVETQMDNPFPNPSNPGYVSGDEYEFTEADHGIPGFIFNITLNSVVLPGGAGWTANPSVSLPPVYPPTINTSGVIKLTSNNNSWKFGANGHLTVPGNGGIYTTSSLEILVDGLTGINASSDLRLYSNNHYITLTDAGRLDLDSPGIKFQDGTIQTTASNYGEADVISLLGEFAKGEAVYGFDSNGILGFPNNFRVGDQGGNGEISTNGNLTLYGGNGAEVSTAGGDYLWTFDNTGDLEIPGSIFSTDSFALFSEVSANSSGLYISGDKTDGGTAILYSTNSTVIRADNNGTIKDWTFGSDGQLTLPADGVIKDDDSLHIYVFDSNVATLESTYNLKVMELSAAFASESWTGAGYPAGPTSAHALALAKAMNPLIPDAWITISSQLETAYDAWQTALNGKHWVFNIDGNLTFPSGAGFGLGETGQLKVNDAATASLDLRDSSGRGHYTNNDGFSLRSNGNKTWVFGSVGDLLLPNGGELSSGNDWPDSVWLTAPLGATKTAGIRDFFGKTVAFAKEDSFVIESSRADGPKIWTFSETGTFTFPDATVQETAFQDVASHVFFVHPNPGRTFTATGTYNSPFATITEAVNAAVAAGHSDADSATIILLANITENVTLKPGIWLTSLGTGTHGSPTITGTVTVTSSTGTTVTNHYSISYLRIVAPTNGHCINFTGTAPQKLFIRDLWLDANGTGDGLYMDNTGSGSTVQFDIGHLAHSGTGDIYCINVTKGSCYVTDIETTGATQVAAVQTGAVLTIDGSELVANGDIVCETYGTGTLTITNSIITNTLANSTGIKINDAGGTVTIGNNLITVPAGTGYALQGPAGGVVYHANNVFTTNAYRSTGLGAGFIALPTAWSTKA